MADHVFNLGSLPLAEFLRVSPGDGLDPADSDYIQPQFSESPLREGGALINEDVNNREQEWPLFLGTRINATREIVASHRKAIQQQLRRDGAMIEWKEPGAATSTFYDVEAGRLEEDYNIRITGKGRAKAVLRTWVSPYGHTGTQVVLGTAVASGVAISMPIPVGSISGDAPALLKAVIGSGSYATPGEGFQAGLAVIPNSAYTWKVPAASISGMSVVGATWAPGSQAQPLAQGAQIALSPASAYVGRSHRLLALMRVGGTNKCCIRTSFEGEAIGPTAMATARGPALVDLGIFRIPANYAGPTVLLNIDTFGALPANLTVQNSDRGLASTMIAEAYIFPEDKFVFGQSPRRVARAFTTFYHALGVSLGSQVLAGQLETFGNAWSVPSFPLVAVSPTSPFAWEPAFGPGAGQGASGFQTSAAQLRAIAERELTIRADVDLQTTQFAFATTGSASAGIGVFVTDDTNYGWAAVKGGGQKSFSLSQGDWNISGGGGQFLHASIGLASPLADMNLIFRKQGAIMTTELRSNASEMLRVLTGAGAATFMPYASLSAEFDPGFSGGAEPQNAHPGMFSVGTRGLVTLSSFTVSEIPSSMPRVVQTNPGVAAANFAELTLDDIRDRTFLQNATVTGGALDNDDVLHLEVRMRGLIPKLLPEDVQVVAIAQDLENNLAVNRLDLTCSFRDRFSYAR